METPFQHLPVELRVVADLVYRTAREECPPDACPVAPFLAACVTESVERLEHARVTSHLPIFALRRVRCCIRAGTCDCGPC
ncbi:MAG: hypothetical protein IT336_07945 [Thermomicrobiales bacterium]|nr:hypothetical protein [Thermomicrobiales bacterium]